MLGDLEAVTQQLNTTVFSLFLNVFMHFFSGTILLRFFFVSVFVQYIVDALSVSLSSIVLSIISYSTLL